jgi:hypothetical protein
LEGRRRLLVRYLYQIQTNVSSQFEMLVKKLWEAPIKQFYSECQSSRDLPPSQSARSTAAPISVGLRTAGRQSIREGIRCSTRTISWADLD